MKRKIGWICIILVLLLFVLSSIITAAQDEAALKEEVVYGILANDGQVEEIVVVNAFTLNKAGTITDYGDYASLTNLTTTDSLTYENGRVQVSAGEGRFYYQGRMNSQNLPWVFDISYRLDKKEVTAHELTGKDGHLDIQIDIRKNSAVDPVFFENMTLQTVLTLDSEKCRNIRADGAATANAGKDKKITYTVMPNMEKTFEVSADVSNFTMDGIQFNGISLQMEIEEPGLTGFVNSIEQLQAGISALDEGARAVHNGTGAMKTGLAELGYGAREIAAGSEMLSEHANSLADGISDLNSGMHGLQSGTDKLKSGLQALTAENEMLIQGAGQIFDSLLMSANAQLEPLNQQLAAMQITIPALTQKNYAEALTGAIEQLDNHPAAVEVRTQVSAFKDQLDAYNQFYAGLNDYTAGVSQAAAGSSQLLTGATELTEGTEKAAANTSSFADGAGRLAGSIQQLSEGITDMKDGAEELHNGTGELSAGTAELNRKTANMDQEIEESMNSLLGQFGDNEFEPQSFVSTQNTKVDTLQFIIKTPGITAKEEEKHVETTDEKNSTFWEKILELFGL